jgi:hypothetical protein
LVKQRRSAGDFGASLNENGRQEARERRADLHEVGFGVALPLVKRRVAGAPPPPGRGHRRERDRKNDASIHRLDLMQRECIVALSLLARVSKGEPA